MKVMFVSLGCDKNLVDTENMLGILNDRGFTFTDDEMEAEVIAVNTCCFIHDAKQESINTILEMAEHKKDGKCKILIVTGCLAHRYQDEITKEIPEVDAFIGTSSYDKIADVIEAVLDGRTYNSIEDTDRLPLVRSKRVVTTGGYYEYLKIAEGCDKHCTYCIIPKIRGNYRSYPMDYLVEQAEALVANGAKELILVAQETTVYGTDIYGKKALPELLHKLGQIEDLKWIRILYCYPEEINDELIQAIKNEPKVCHYLDMPIQHCNDAILKKMGRRTNKKEIQEIVTKLREAIPDIILRTTLITGFPGETEDNFEEMMDFVDEMEFDRLGVFPYSPEEGTPAAEFPDQIDEEVKADRQCEIMELQQDIAFEKSERRIGQEMLAVIEGKVADENAYIGRTYMDAPNIDGYVFIHTDEALMTGDFVKVKITASSDYDLIGELV